MIHMILRLVSPYLGYTYNIILQDIQKTLLIDNAYIQL